MRIFIRDIRIGIKNLVNWFPIIWNDRQWDHSFFYEIMRFKLNKMEKYLRHNGHHIGSEKSANKIKVCVMLLNRLMEDNYHDLIFRPHDKKWGESKMYVKDDGYVEIDYPNVKTDEDKVNQKKDFRNRMSGVEYLNKQDLDYLFSILNKHIRNWWD